MSPRLAGVVILGLIGLAPLGGCGRRLPAVVPVQGTVLVNGKPLPKARVTFVPQLDNFGAESNSTAVTDENGQFTLTCTFNGQPGAVVAKHVVLVAEASLPEEMRNVRDARVIRQYQAKLGNRPIPSRYSSVRESPIQIDIKDGQEPVTLKLSR
jgi:hypothetical protein